MSRYEEMKNEIKELVDLGMKMYEALRKDDKGEHSKDLSYFLSHYELWYSKALLVIKQILPHRVDDFVRLYRDDKRKDLEFSTYVISDAMRTATHFGGSYGTWTAALCVARQASMLRSCLDSFDSKIYSLQMVLQADVFDSEIDAARHLLKKGFLRAAGAICGVVLEKHFSIVASNHNIGIKKKAPTIADFNDAFKEVVYDVIEWRKMQHLGDIRNLCDHNKGREPSKEEVEELINGTDRVIKTIF